MNKINEFKSINEASRQTNIKVVNISTCCIKNFKNKLKNHKSSNYIWKYKK